MSTTDRLDTFLADHDADAYLFDTDGSNADQYYLSGFTAPDPFIAAYHDGGMTLFVSGLEYGRAKKQAADAEVVRHSTYDYRDLQQTLGGAAGRAEAIRRLLVDRGIESVLVPQRFPLETADELRARGVTVSVAPEPVIGQLRATKTDTEIEHIQTTQQANEAAMATAEQLLEAASIEDGVLVHDGAPLTSERVKRAIEHTLIDHDCALEETIVAGGAQGADPHDRGSGPLPAEKPIVIDIFPKDSNTKYYADMTRTFLKGTPTDELQHRYQTTKAAHEAALEALEPGATGAAVHDAVCDVYEEAGYATLRSDPETETGFIHSTGHGVGLAVHEHPRVSPSGEELEAGNVVTIEPGVYDPALGGIRIEDLVVVAETDTGYRNLTDYPKEFVL